MDPDQVSCQLCGTTADLDVARVTWSFGTERGRPVWTCPTCTRTHARSVEAKLDTQWW